MVNFNDSIYFFQRGYQPLIYNTVASGTSGGANSNVVTLSSVNSAAGLTSAMYGNEVLAAYGRLWTADFSTDKSTIYWSDLLSGHIWTGGSSGSIDISKVWPDGHDEIVALAAHNDHLIVFGKRSSIVYSGAETPSSMTLADTISGVGCVGRDTVQSTVQTLFFCLTWALKVLVGLYKKSQCLLVVCQGQLLKTLLHYYGQKLNFLNQRIFLKKTFTFNLYRF